MKRPIFWASLSAFVLLVVWVHAGSPMAAKQAPLSRPTQGAAAAPAPAAVPQAPNAVRPAPARPRKVIARPTDPVPAQLARNAPLTAARARLKVPGVDRRAALAAYRKELDRQLRAARADPASVIAQLESPRAETRMQAIVVLTELASEPAAGALATALARERERGLRLALLHGLARIGGGTAREALMRHYRETAGDRHRYLVVRAIGDLADGKTVPLLVEALRAPGDPALRAHAVKALSKVGGADAREALEAARDAESHEAVAAAIRRALKKHN